MQVSCIMVKKVIKRDIFFPAFMLLKIEVIKTILLSQDSLAAVEEVMNGVCPSVYRPVDCVLKALFTSPCELVKDLFRISL